MRAQKASIVCTSPGLPRGLPVIDFCCSINGNDPVFTFGSNASDDFVTADERIGTDPPVVVAHAEIAATDATAFDRNVHLVVAQFSQFVYEWLKSSPGST